MKFVDNYPEEFLKNFIDEFLKQSMHDFVKDLFVKFLGEFEAIPWMFFYSANECQEIQKPISGEMLTKFLKNVLEDFLL